MENKEKSKRKPGPERLEALKRIPADIIGRLTKEEISAFLLEDVWPDSLREKLKDHLVDQH